MSDPINTGAHGSNADRVRSLASQYIGIRSAPAGFDILTSLSQEALAYYSLTPYPWYGDFRNWKTEERGPYPKCMPFCRTMVDKPARWLFGQEPEITIKQDLDLEKWVRSMWTENRMPSKMVAAASKAGYQGGIALRFSYDKEMDPALTIQTLSIVDDCRLYYDPLDVDRLVMVRIQFPYYDPLETQWYFYREEWTDWEEVHYKPLKAQWVSKVGNNGLSFPQVAYTLGESRSPDDSTLWEETWRRGNLFGVIPIHPIKNLEKDSVWGIGTAWGLFRPIDRVNLNFHLMDRSTQRDEPSTIWMDVDVDKKDADRPLNPTSALSVKSDVDEDGNTRKGEVKIVEARGDLRDPMFKEAMERMRQILDASSVTILNSTEFTNKGNLTSAVLTQLYAPMLELMGEMRKTYGEDGVAKFIEKMIRALKRAGIKIPAIQKVKPEDPDTHDVSLRFQAPFYLPDDEKNLAVTRWGSSVQYGFTTQTRAIEAVAALEGVQDIQQLVAEMAPAIAAADTAQVARIENSGIAPPSPDATDPAKAMQASARQAKSEVSL